MDTIPQDPENPNLDPDQPNDPAEGARDDEDTTPSPIPSTHIPDNRAFDL